MNDETVFAGWLPLSEAARELKVAYATAAKHLRTVKFGNQLVVSREDVERFRVNPPVQGRSPDKKLADIATYLDLPIEVVREHRQRARAKQAAERKLRRASKKSGGQQKGNRKR